VWIDYANSGAAATGPFSLDRIHRERMFDNSGDKLYRRTRAVNWPRGKIALNSPGLRYYRISLF